MFSAVKMKQKNQQCFSKEIKEAKCFSVKCVRCLRVYLNETIVSTGSFITGNNIFSVSFFSLNLSCRWSVRSLPRSVCITESTMAIQISAIYNSVSDNQTTIHRKNDEFYRRNHHKKIAASQIFSFTRKPNQSNKHRCTSGRQNDYKSEFLIIRNLSDSMLVNEEFVVINSSDLIPS